MPGYANRTIMLDFPELSEEGDRIHVVIKNPKTLPLGELTPKGAEHMNENDMKLDEAMPAMFAVIAGMVKAWHVYDATSEQEDQPSLPLPATADLVAKLPHEITSRIMDLIAGVMKTSEDPS